MKHYPIVIFVPVWKRPEITIPALKAMKQYGHVIAGISETSYVDICKGLDIDYFMCPNNPLGTKLNQLLNHILSSFTFDYMLQMGSDNYLEPETWSTYQQLMKEGVDCFGVSKVAMVQGNEAQEFDYKTCVGAGRVFRYEPLRRAAGMIKVKFNDGAIMNGDYVVKGEEKWVSEKYSSLNVEILRRSFRLWDDSKEKYLDNDSEWTLNCAGITPKIIEGRVIDIKSDANIWKFDQFDGKKIPVPSILKKPKRKRIAARKA